MARFKQSTLIRRQLFVSCGLSEKEAMLYDLLLSLGQASGAVLEKESGLKKNTYALLDALYRKKLVIIMKRDGREIYQPAPPDTLLRFAHQQETAASQTRETLEKLLPALHSQYTLSVGKPTIRYFEGEEGLKQVFADIYAPKKDVVYGCVDLEKADAVFPKHILEDLIPLRVANKVVAHSLVADSAQARAIQMNDEKQLRTTELIDKKGYPLPAEIDVYEDKIAMLSFEQGKFIGIIIQNEAFAQSLRSIFKRNFPPDAHPATNQDSALVSE